jgi:hypothetical protein
MTPSARSGFSANEPDVRQAVEILLTNCQAKDISTYRFPLLRATSRKPAIVQQDERTERQGMWKLRVRRYRA